MDTIGTGNAAGDLAARYSAVRAQTEKLCDPLENEDYVPQPVVFVSPVKWNIAHTTWFFEEFVLAKFVENYERFNEHFSFLFNSYYNTVGSRTNRNERGFLSRPTVRSVFEYRRSVDDAMLKLLGSLDRSSDAEEIGEITTLGINHEQQHQELLLTDLKYTLGQNPLDPVYDAEWAREDQPALGKGEFIKIDEGVYDIGHEGSGFCFDNELARHKVYLDAFSISDRLVTNAEFAEFIEGGGYDDFRLWHADGWDWVRANEIEAPLYWERHAGGWSHFTLQGKQELAPDAPVSHLSFYEAAAYAEMAGMRLPTEFEWEAAQANFEWGQRWEWTASAYLPYPGFTKPPDAVGEYNGKFMVNQMALRGESIATPEGHSRPTYRNFFYPDMRWQFFGLRLARK
ncbi:MAG: serine/threonine protein kinase [Acidobacteria bacterium OLB17]|nr:MAG: serine/threonine protein kinase [Acidobacteria bacterium OLB17]MCZ2390072.1 ergothioneine biosynthesis protein EgtB [Acidobacteriota bacterium]